MTNAVVSYTDMERMAAAIAKSGLFGVKNTDQALALMAVAQAEGLHPATAARDYHVIQGRPALKADAMLARFLAAGGKVQWKQYTDECVSAVFSHPAGGSVEIDWSMARAKAAGLTGKDNWRAYPRQMLRARVISEGIRTVYPGVAVGVYTPEEVQDFAPAPVANTVNPRGDLVQMDPERCLQYADAVAPMLDRDQTAMQRHEAAQLCLAVRALWDELDQDEQIQVNDRLNTKQKNRLKKIYAVPVEKLEEAARVIDVPTEGVAA